MDTNVKFEGVSSGFLQFRFKNGDDFLVLSLKDGVMTVMPSLDCKICSFLKNITDCFKNSNFMGLNRIKVTGLNGVTVSITEETTPYGAIQLWFDEFGKGKLENVSNKKNASIIQALQTEKFQFKDKNARKYWYDLIQSRADDVVYYAYYWGKYMQHLLSQDENVTISQIADMASDAVDFFGMTGFAYTQALCILVQAWKYGDELHKWHNEKHGYKGNGVANPVMLRAIL